jgi:hypothetical protein
MVIPHRKHTYGTPRPVMDIVLLFYKQMMFLPHRKHLWASTARYGNSSIFYRQGMFIPHSKHTCGPPRPVTEIALLLHFYFSVHMRNGARGSVVVKALCYKPEGRGFGTR